VAVLAIDAGTTGVTCLVIDDALRTRGRAYAEFTQHYPRPGWVEHDAEEILATSLHVARAAAKDADVPLRSLAALGITNQRETAVLWDRASGQPVHRAIVWQDRRTAAACHAMTADWEDTVRRRTGLLLDPYFSASKLQWMLDNVPGLRDRARQGGLAFGTVDAWLLWRLTGGRVHATDVTNASRTLLWDIHAGAWDAELLEAFGIPEAVLPDVRPSAHDHGPTDASVFGAEVPVAGLVGDQQGALFGQRCFEAGQAKNTYGTGCFLLQHTGGEAVASRNGLVTTRAASTDGGARFALEGSIFVAGAAVQWVRDGLGLIKAAPEIDGLASQVEDSEGVVLVPAFTGLGAPYWDPHARGALLGITRGTDRRHIARATLDAIAFQSADLVTAMQEDSGTRIEELRVDGGATRSAPLMQIQADVLQRPVVRPAEVDTTAYGSAMLAGLATGVWGMGDFREPGGEKVFRPRIKAEAAEARMRTWHHAVEAVRAYRP